MYVSGITFIMYVSGITFIMYVQAKGKPKGLNRIDKFCYVWERRTSVLIMITCNVFVSWYAFYIRLWISEKYRFMDYFFVLLSCCCLSIHNVNLCTVLFLSTMLICVLVVILSFPYLDTQINLYSTT
jgi:hypothetical protein